jgi:hypothetical protein
MNQARTVAFQRAIQMQKRRVTVACFAVGNSQLHGRESLWLARYALEGKRPHTGSAAAGGEAMCS